MFLRRWNSTTSNLLARRPVFTVAKLAKPRHSFPPIYSRAFASSHNRLIETADANGRNDSARLTTIKVPNRLVQKDPPNHVSDSPSYEFPSYGTNPIEDEPRSLDCGGEESTRQKAQAREGSSPGNNGHGAFGSGSVWDSSSSLGERQRQDLRGWLGEEENRKFSRCTNRQSGSLDPSTLISVPIRSWHVPKQMQDTFSPALSTIEPNTTEDADWSHLSPLRPLYSDLHERFQMPLNTQQIWKLQKMANYNNTRSVMTREFGEKSQYSYDWTRPLEILQFEAQGEGSAHNIPHDQANVTYYHLEEGHESSTSASEIRIPTQWTSFSFAAFVTRVTRLRHLSWDKRRDRRHRSLSVEVTDTCLMSLFNDPNMRQYLSVDAFNSALTFFYTHKHHSIHRVRELYSLMEVLQMDTDPRTFGIMLAAATRQGDLALLSYVLTVMVRKGVRPTRKAWLRLLETVQAKVVRTYIIKIMRAHGLCEDVAMIRSIVGLTLPPELPNHVQSGQNVQSFFDFVDATYGIEWPTTTIGNQMTQELCRVGLFSDALQIWHILQARGCLPDGHTLHIFLSYCQKLFDIGTSIEIVRHFWCLYGLKPGAFAHDVLFRHAWAMRSYNCCKLVWQHACMEGYSHSKMSSMLLFSLTRWDEQEPELVLRSGFNSAVEEFFNPSDAWFKGAGKVVLENDHEVFHSILEELKGSRGAEESPSAPVFWEDPWDRDVALESLQHKETSLAAMQIQDEFLDLLIAAYETDRVWHDRNFWKQPTQWKVTNAIKIPIANHQIHDSEIDWLSIPIELEGQERMLQQAGRIKKGFAFSPEVRWRLVPVDSGDEDIICHGKDESRQRPMSTVRPDSTLSFSPPNASLNFCGEIERSSPMPNISKVLAELTKPPMTVVPRRIYSPVSPPNASLNICGEIEGSTPMPNISKVLSESTKPPTTALPRRIYSPNMSKYTELGRPTRRPDEKGLTRSNQINMQEYDMNPDEGEPLRSYERTRHSACHDSFEDNASPENLTVTSNVEARPCLTVRPIVSPRGLMRKRRTISMARLRETDFTNKAQVNPSSNSKAISMMRKTSRVLLRRCSWLRGVLHRHRALAAIGSAKRVRRVPGLALDRSLSARRGVVRTKEIPLRLVRHISRKRHVSQKRMLLHTVRARKKTADVTLTKSLSIHKFNSIPGTMRSAAVRNISRLRNFRRKRLASKMPGTTCQQHTSTTATVTKAIADMASKSGLSDYRVRIKKTTKMPSMTTGLDSRQNKVRSRKRSTPYNTRAAVQIRGHYVLGTTIAEIPPVNNAKIHVSAISMPSMTTGLDSRQNKVRSRNRSTPYNTRAAVQIRKHFIRDTTKAKVLPVNNAKTHISATLKVRKFESASKGLPFGAVSQHDQVIQKYFPRHPSIAEVQDLDSAGNHSPAMPNIVYVSGEMFAFRRPVAAVKRLVSAARDSWIPLKSFKKLVRPSIRNVACGIAADALDTTQRATRRVTLSLGKMPKIASIRRPWPRIKNDTAERAWRRIWGHSIVRVQMARNKADKSIRRPWTRFKNETAEMAWRRVWGRSVMRLQMARNKANKSIRRLLSEVRSEAAQAARLVAWRHRYRRRQRAAAFKRTRQGLLKIVKGQRPTLIRESSRLRNPFTLLGLRWQRKFAASRKHQAAINLQAEFSDWLEKLAPRETSGFKPLREPVETSSFFRETVTRATVRELQELDLSQAETSNQAQSTTSSSNSPDPVGNDIHDLAARKPLQDTRRRRSLVLRKLIVSKKGSRGASPLGTKNSA